MTYRIILSLTFVLHSCIFGHIRSNQLESTREQEYICQEIPFTGESKKKNLTYVEDAWLFEIKGNGLKKVSYLYIAPSIAKKEDYAIPIFVKKKLKEVDILLTEKSRNSTVRFAEASLNEISSLLNKKGRSEKSFYKRWVEKLLYFKRNKKMNKRIWKITKQIESSLRKSPTNFWDVALIRYPFIKTPVYPMDMLYEYYKKVSIKLQTGYLDAELIFIDEKFKEVGRTTNPDGQVFIFLGKGKMNFGRFRNEIEPGLFPRRKKRYEEDISDYKSKQIFKIKKRYDHNTSFVQGQQECYYREMYWLEEMNSVMHSKGSAFFVVEPIHQQELVIALRETGYEVTPVDVPKNQMKK